MTYKHILNIDPKEKIQKIIEKEFIQFEIHYKYNKREKEFFIYEKTSWKEIYSDTLDVTIFEEDPKKKKICKTIQLYIKRFPDLVKTNRIMIRPLLIWTLK